MYLRDGLVCDGPKVSFPSYPNDSGPEKVEQRRLSRAEQSPTAGPEKDEFGRALENIRKTEPHLRIKDFSRPLMVASGGCYSLRFTLDKGRIGNISSNRYLYQEVFSHYQSLKSTFLDAS